MPDYPMSLADVNALGRDGFVALFGDVAEHSPWVAEAAARGLPFASRRAMSEAFLDAILDADEPHKLALLRAHPDLAGRAAIAGDLAAESKKEQAGAGLDRLTAEEFARFTELNNAYRQKFGFPFILAVKGATKDQILKSFAERVKHDHEREFAAALIQVARIVAFRIEDRVAP
jgi:2-oxo-4-hydroxy-4-carboxy-5-ureidoimidazoline decarboxylase